MTYFVVTIKKISAERLARLFSDNVWKLYGLPESIVFAAEITKKLNSMLGIEMKLLTSFHL